MLIESSDSVMNVCCFRALAPEFSGEANVGEMLSGIVPTSVASPTGFET
jgi:hypothetical protein